MTSSSPPPLLQVQGVSKRFGGVRALRDVTVGFHGGQVHALVGENGAGKSTLAKVVAGVHQPDSGELLHRGEPARLSSPAAALAAGISVIYQELSLIPELTVAANVFLAHEARTRRGTLDERHMRRRTDELLEQLGARFDAGALVADLSAADQQLAEIARALNHRAEIIVMDEPTASLPEDSARHLFGVVRGLRARGACVIYVSHELGHVFELADRVTVLKDGQHVLTRDVAQTSPEEVIRGMVGRTLGEMFPPRAAASAKASGPNGGAGARPPALRVEGLSLPGHFEDVSFEVRAGEIVGVAGLIGAGRTAVARTVFGAPPAVGGALALRGSVQVEGRELHPRNPRDAIAAGIAYVPEERKTDGLALDLSVVENLSLPQLAELARGGVIDRGREAALATEQIGALAIRTPGARVPAGNLSGGNQQKVVLGKWLARGCKVLILDEPTTGIDIGAKVEIYRLLRQLATRGVAILLISSDLLEVLGLSDRVLVMRKGRIAARVDGNDASEEELIRSALGAEDGEEVAP